MTSPQGRAIGRVGVVGAGQVGTMLGLALRRAPGRAGVEEVALFDRDRSAARASLARGAGDRVVRALEEAFDADVVILALPVPAIVSTLESHGARLGRGQLLLDTGSAKGAVVDAMRAHVPGRAHVLGGHPLVGTAVAGAEGARPELLDGAMFVLTPVRDDAEALTRGRALVGAIGSRAVEMDATTHDRVMARTSHLAHVAAFALAAVGRRRGAAEELVSSGYLGATRLAGSDPRMVAGFLSANASDVRAAISELVEELVEMRSLLAGDADDLAAQLEIRRNRPSASDG